MKITLLFASMLATASAFQASAPFQKVRFEWFALVVARVSLPERLFIIPERPALTGSRSLFPFTIDD